jgi:hypothetical protein
MAIYDHLNLKQIGDEFGLTSERVRQILRQNGADYETIRARRANRERAYQEAVQAAKARCTMLLPDGRTRPEYLAYRNMLQRCFKKNCRGYERYGGRGISVCDKWLGKFGFESFLLDMGARPEGRYPSGRAMYSIHRKDNDGDYEPGNCKWATQAEQCANRRKQQRKEFHLSRREALPASETLGFNDEEGG